LKTTNEMIDEIVLEVRPPRGTAILLTEPLDSTPNWVAATGLMDLGRTTKFSAKVAALRKSTPIIDWSTVSERQGDKRRVAKWLSEVVGASALNSD
jgi:hypothetical protein